LDITKYIKVSNVVKILLQKQWFLVNPMELFP